MQITTRNPFYIPGVNDKQYEIKNEREEFDEHGIAKSPS
jgi:hypothetical protein